MNWIKRQIGTLHCLFIHFFITDSWKMKKPYAPWECEKCGRVWEW